MEKVRINKLPNVACSAAGPGSDFFRKYRAHRDKEIDRIEDMAEHERIENETDKARLAARASQERLESKTTKNRENRHKRKQQRRGVSIPAEVREKIIADEVQDRIDHTRTDEEPPRKVVVVEAPKSSSNHPGIRIITSDDF